MGFLDELKEAEAEGYAKAGGISVEEAKAELAAAKAKKPKRKITLGNILGLIVLGFIGFLVLGRSIFGLVIGAVIGFFCGGFLLGLIKKAIPTLSTEGEDIITNMGNDEDKKTQ